MFAETVPLASARTVHSLRAVFGETYPDPVRVVSVGQAVPDLVADPENSAWMGYSVELCGGTHLKNTSAAGRFALLEEGSIAKGIRRIVGVTKDAATSAHGRAMALHGDFAAARALAGPALEARTATLKAALDVAEIPAVQKLKLRDELSELQKRVTVATKAAAKKTEDAAKAAALGAVTAAGPDAKFLVLDIPSMAGDSTPSQAIRKAVTDAAPGLAFLGITSNGTDKVFVFAHVPAAASSSCGLKATEWVQSALALAAGRSGGTDAAAQGSGPNAAPATVAAMVDAARAFVAGKL